MTTSGSCARTGSITKVFKLPDGSLLGIAGSAGLTDRFKEYIEGHHHLEPLNYFDANGEAMQVIYVHHFNDTVYKFTDGRLVEIENQYHAIGSGQDFAFGALAAGATPQQAIEVAALFDCFTGREFERVVTDSRIAREVDAMEKIARAAA
jgi:ATP-dependent protease HslVU (ClpYQ) peptidase subunit